MSNAAHTPGPWKVAYGDSGRPRAIAADHDMSSPGGVGHIVRWNGIGFPSSPTAQANARLIAAAPDLLAALELMADQYEQICKDNKVMGWPAALLVARSAIAKASGDA